MPAAPRLPRTTPRWPRLAALAPAIFTLVAGALAGLVRLGWTDVSAPGGAVAFHGGLMVAGFFGTLIGLERAVALGARWAWAAPILTGGGAIVLVAGGPLLAGTVALAAGSAVFTAASLVVTLRQPALFTSTMLLGAACWLAGDMLWALGRPITELAPWWTFFLVLTIAGERLELSRLVMPPRGALRLFTALLPVVPVAGLLATLAPRAGALLTGLVFAALALWLARWDVARRTIRQKALPRYIAWCLFAGYVWLAFAGVMLVAGGPLAPGLRGDAILHAIFLGFAFSMVFGHAPIIFPAVVRVPVRYRPALYLPLVLLHASLVVRVGADLAGAWDVRRWAGLGNVAALAAFFLLIATDLLAARLRRTTAPPARVPAPVRTAS